MTNGHVHPVMRSALNALVPTMAETEKHALLMNLYGALESIDAEYADLEARRHDVQEQMARIQGDDLFAEWHRFAAEAARDPSPEAKQIAHRAWVVAMAARHLKDGTAPGADSFHRDEIAAEMKGLAALTETTRAAG